MKRIVASVGVLALGAAVCQTSNAQGIGDGKPWTFSAALRGFYDDNVNTTSQNEVDTFGVEISPSVGFRAGLDQTSFSLAYTYAYKWYDDAPSFSDDHDDNTHTFLASLTHAFNERTSVSVRDSFVMGQEPELDPSYASFQRISGNNLHNFGSIKVDHQITPIIGMQVGYDNSYFDYDNELIPGALFVLPSSSGTLDRIEHRAHLDGRWSLANNSTLIVGYEFRNGCYTGDEPLNATGTLTSSDRNYMSHYGYVGIEHTFRPDLTGNIRGGLRFTDYYNSPDDESSLFPYLQGSLRYLYAQDSYVEVGVSVDQVATDAFSTQGLSITTDANSTRAYATVTHKFTPDLTGSLAGTFQNNNYNGGSIDGETEQYYILNAALSYQFTPYLAGTLSYNLDHVASDLPGREYDRNRVYLGAVFSY